MEYFYHYGPDTAGIWKDVLGIYGLWFLSSISEFKVTKSLGLWDPSLLKLDKEEHACPDTDCLDKV